VEQPVARYIIIGAGAVGGTIGGRLFESGHDVVMVARGAHYEALRDKGLHLITPDGARTLPIPAIDRPEALELRQDDVLILSAKTQDSAAAFDSWAGRPVLGGRVAAASLPIVLAQNGVESERMALRRFRHVYGMCVWLPATHLEPGVVEAQGAPLSGVLHLGRYPQGEDELGHRISDDLEKSGFRAPVRPQIMRWKYGKLLSNLANALDALVWPGTDAETQQLQQRVRAEGVAALDAAGIDHASPEEEAPFRELIRLQPVGGRQRQGGSSWQSLARGTGSIEADYLNGEIALLGRQYGVPTPVNEALQQAANASARERRAPGSLTVAELTALVDQYAEEADRRPASRA
jgi:2-dehydropantoate 2-reductase